MRKLAPVLLAALMFGAVAEAQTRCRNNTAWCVGSKDTDVVIGGNIYSTSPDGGLSLTSSGVSGTNALVKTTLLDAGSGYINGNLGVLGTEYVALVDAGAVNVANNLGVGGTIVGTTRIDTLDAGAVNIQGTLGLNQALRCGADVACGSIALSSGTPSTATKTVTAGSTCFCWPVGNTAVIAAAGCAASVSSTTATFTGPNTVTTTVGYICFK